MKSREESVEDIEELRQKIVGLVRALDGANNRLLGAINRLDRRKISPEDLIQILREISKDEKFISLEKKEAVHEIRSSTIALIAELKDN